MSEFHKILGFDLDMNRGTGEIKVYKKGVQVCRGNMRIDEDNGKMSFDFEGDDECEKMLKDNAELIKLMNRR